jgi:ABC-type Zn uptake system ZnuABC Zn-binding protein ZnuA
LTARRERRAGRAVPPAAVYLRRMARAGGEGLSRRAFAAGLAAAVAAAAGGASRARGATSPPPRIAATIFPLYDLARQVAGDVAEVVLLLPPGASPHTFEPTPARVRDLAGARVLLAVGHGLDDWGARLAQQVGVPRVVTADAGIALRPLRGAAGSSAVDPHYWLAAANAATIARTIGAEIARLVPERRSRVDAARDACVGMLTTLDGELRRLLADLPDRRIATFHDAFGYFAAAYGLEIVAVFEPSPGREPGPRFVQAFHDAVRAAGVRVLFHEPQLSVEALRPIARDLGVTLAVLDPLGGLPGRETYVGTMRFDARQVAAALRARAPRG